MEDFLIRESYFNTSLSILINKADLKNKDLTNCYGYLICVRNQDIKLLFISKIYIEFIIWKPPHIGSYKVNWDAALDHQNSCMGYGYIARDSNGMVVAAACHSVRYGF
jgi:hypothetical protein